MICYALEKDLKISVILYWLMLNCFQNNSLLRQNISFWWTAGPFSSYFFLCRPPPSRGQLRPSAIPGGNHIFALFKAYYVNICMHEWTACCSGPWKGSVRGPCGKGRHFGGRGAGAPSGGRWASVESGQGRWEDITKCLEARKTTPSRLQGTIMHRLSVNVHRSAIV
jgi:hypothetical protein